MHQDDLIAAIGHYEEGLRRKDDVPTVHNKLAYLLSTQGRFGEAIDHFRRAVQLDPNYGEAYFNMAVVLETVGELDQAIQHYRQALRTMPVQKLNRSEEKWVHFRSTRSKIGRPS